MSEHDDDRPLQREDLTDPVEIAERPRAEAWLLAGRLSAEGIPAAIYPPTESSEFGTALQPIHSVLVSRTDVEKAEEIVREIDEGEDAIGEDDLQDVDGDDGPPE